MTDYVTAALFVFDEKNEHLLEPVRQNSFAASITAVAFPDFIRDPEKYLGGLKHVLISGSLDTVKAMLELALIYKFSVGLVPALTQKDQIRLLDLPRKMDAIIELSLRKNALVMDLVQCNDKIMLSRATVGCLPILDVTEEGMSGAFLGTLKRLNKLNPVSFVFTTAEGKQVKTAAIGCMLVQHHQGSVASRLIGHDNSAVDGMVSLVIASPFSKIQYLRFLLETYGLIGEKKRLPSIMGYIKSPGITIESGIPLDVFIDGKLETQTPVYCQTLPRAVRINVGDWLKDESVNSKNGREKIKCENLPNLKEQAKITGKKLPLFSSASEERFRDLFLALREDARINETYLVLMLLSSLLATVGLYLDSAAVIIGAMLLAPLMTPIVSLAMGVLRQDNPLLKNSLYKVAVGIGIALLASASVSMLFPHDPMTTEMRARLNPTLLDLAVAIISGIAGAYSKAFREIIQSLAGVAIAVALVPPLAVSGIGIGRGDFLFFIQAFLLFTTNLIGIVLAATVTFRVLGYSPVIQSKRSMGMVVLSLALIMIPLYLSYEQIVSQIVFEHRMQTDRFLVNGKYIIIQSAKISRYNEKQVVVMRVLARETLSRSDMNKLKKKIQYYFDIDMVIRMNIFYIL